MQLPSASHAEFWRHAPFCEHAVPAANTVSSHSPVVELQLDAWHGPGSAHTFFVPTHSPPLHAVASAHLSVALHASPFIVLLVEQGAPTACVGSQTPTLHCVVNAVQSFGVTEQFPLVHAPTELLQPLPPQVAVLGRLVSSQLPVAGLHAGNV